MIHLARIPPILNRSFTDQVTQTAILVTADDGRLGSTSMTFVGPDGSRELVKNSGTLIADIAVNYQRLRDEYAGLDNNNNNGTMTSTKTTKKKSHMQYVCCWNWTKDSWEFRAVSESIVWSLALRLPMLSWG
jgi:hypothetical protein